MTKHKTDLFDFSLIQMLVVQSETVIIQTLPKREIIFRVHVFGEFSKISENFQDS